MDDESTRRVLEEAERLQNIIAPKAADELKRLSDLMSPYANVGAASEVEKAMKQLEEVKAFVPSTMPYLEPILPPRIPDFEETNHFQSAGVMLRRLAESIRAWRAQLPNDLQPGVIALLNSGVQIDVASLAQESFHGIRVSGRIGDAECVVLAHQATLQILCIAQPVRPPDSPKRPIGFIIDGQHSTA
jgi:hypothetical protein